MNTVGTPIRRKLMTIVLLTSGVVLLITTVASFAYEFLTYRQSAISNLTTLGSVIASNSTAALAFENEEDARVTLSALRAEPHIVAGALYDTSRQAVRHLSGGPDGGRAARRPGAARLSSSRSRFSAAFSRWPRTARPWARCTCGRTWARSTTGCGCMRMIAALVIAVSILVAYLMSRSPAEADLAADPGARRYGARHLGAQGLFRPRRAHRRPRARAAHRRVQPDAHGDPDAARQAQQPARAACTCCSTSRAPSASGRTCRACCASWCKASRTACRPTSLASA